LRDLGLRHLGAAGDELLHLGLGLCQHALGLGIRAGQDVGGFAFRIALLALILREQRLRLLLEPQRLVELGLDAVAALRARP
jgi:hypothetical protein